MIYVIFLFAFNCFIIILLSNVKAPSIPNIFEFKIDIINGMINMGDDPVEIKNYHSINMNNKKENDNDK